MALRHFHVLSLVLNRIHSEEVEKNKLPDFVDYDAYDAEVFKCAQTQPRPQIVTPGYNPFNPFRDNRKTGDTDMVEKFLEDENLTNNSDIIKSKSSSMLINNRRHQVSLCLLYGETCCAVLCCTELCCSMLCCIVLCYVVL